jgi:hypothetical protein
MGVAQRIACLAGAWFWSVLPIAGLAEGPGSERLWPAAYFDDGNDKQAVVDLRARKARGEVLTEMEEAILVAAARTGQITICGDRSASNAFLVRIGGRDAIITTAHAAIDMETGASKCTFTETYFYPNMSFYDASDGEPNPSNFEKLRVQTDKKEPLWAPEIKFMHGIHDIDLKTDFAIFFLERDVSSDLLPDGSTRGNFEVARDFPFEVEIFLFGTDPSFRNGRATAFQNCPSTIGSFLILHRCDTIKGVSSSALVIFDEGQFKVMGIHTDGEQGTFGPDSLGVWNWNGGLSIEWIQQFLEEAGQAIE